jgi:hypothetical protein
VAGSVERSERRFGGAAVLAVLQGDAAPAAGQPDRDRAPDAA